MAMCMPSTISSRYIIGIFENVCLRYISGLRKAPSGLVSLREVTQVKWPGTCFSPRSQESRRRSLQIRTICRSARYIRVMKANSAMLRTHKRYLHGDFRFQVNMPVDLIFCAILLCTWNKVKVVFDPFTTGWYFLLLRIVSHIEKLKFLKRLIFVTKQNGSYLERVWR